MQVQNLIMDNIISAISYFKHSILAFIDVGGMVMWPLFACCLWMIWLASQMLFKSYQLSCHLNITQTYPSWLNQRIDKITLRQIYQQQYFDLQGVKLLAMVAPLLGLLGTVNGMIEMFSAGARYGFHDPAVISSGISMAMITTQTGLLVGLTGAVLAFFWQRKLNKIQNSDLVRGHYAK